MARNTPTWLLALALVATGCTVAPATDGSTPTTASTSTTTSTTVAPTTVAPTTTRVIDLTEESPSLSSTTTVTTVTTEAPGSEVSDPKLPAINTDFDIEDLDELIADLDEILADFDSSLAEQEGDIFDD